MLKIKVCGITSVEDARAASEEGADYLGLIFSKSPRRIEVAVAREVVRACPASTIPVGVFKDQPFEEVRAILHQTGLAFAQLHGHESPDYAATIGATVFKTFESYRDETLEELRKYDVFAFLLDLPKDPISRTVVDPHWAVCAKKFGRVIVSGGLTSDTVGEILRKVRPFGIDVCRATESSPGRKDLGKLREFLHAAREAEQATTSVRVKVR